MPALATMMATCDACHSSQRSDMQRARNRRHVARRRPTGPGHERVTRLTSGRPPVPRRAAVELFQHCKPLLGSVWSFHLITGRQQKSAAPLHARQPAAESDAWSQRTVNPNPDTRSMALRAATLGLLLLLWLQISFARISSVHIRNDERPLIQIASPFGYGLRTLLAPHPNFLGKQGQLAFTNKQ